MLKLMEYLNRAVELGASDVFMVAGAPVSFRIDGDIREMAEQKLLPDATSALVNEIFAAAGRDMEKFLKTGDDDFSFSVPGLARFRSNIYRQRGSVAAIIRVVAFNIPSREALGIPDSVMELAGLSHGLVIFTGTAGSGKSTTQACIVDRINHTRRCHIITLEDPIEYLHRDDLSIVSQREVSIDTENFITALRASLRQSPDVIQLGEMRDLETIRSAMTAAETGHLVFATLHTGGAVNTIDRIIDIFPPEQQEQIRIQLCAVLRTVVSQQLLPCREGGMVPAFEIMHMNTAVRSLIRERKTYQIDNVISTSASAGMITMDRYVLQLYRSSRITRDTALAYSENREFMLRQMN